MTGVFQEVWKFFQYYILPVLPFVALVLIEIQLMYNRRENEVMFGTDAFNEKIKAFEFTPKEVRTLEKLVRTSKFENKDAVLNSSMLFETAVKEFYRVRNVMSVRDETLDAVASLRAKMGFTGANPLTMVCSTRQFCEGDRIDLEFEDSRVIKRAVILERSEKNWSVHVEGLEAISKNPVGASYGMTDTMGRMHSDAQFAGSSSVPAHVEMMGFLGAGNNPMVGMTVAVAVAVQEAMSK